MPELSIVSPDLIERKQRPAEALWYIIPVQSWPGNTRLARTSLTGQSDMFLILFTLIYRKKKIIVSKAVTLQSRLNFANEKTSW